MAQSKSHFAKRARSTDEWVTEIMGNNPKEAKAPQAAASKGMGSAPMNNEMNKGITKEQSSRSQPRKKDKSY